MSKRETGAERRTRLDEVKRAQKAEQRRKNLLTAGIGALVGVVIIGGTVFFIAAQESKKPTNKAIDEFGVAAAAADCDPVSTEKVGGAGEHVGPGTNKPDVVTVKYSTVPPTSGQHYPTWLPSSRNFYSVDDSPKVEQLVHNLEHGYTVVWYSPELPAGEVDTLEGLSEKISSDLPGNKFIVAPWNPAYGELPADKAVAISHWGAKSGYRQVCGAVSGPAIKAFVDAHPSTDAPEPNAA